MKRLDIKYAPAFLRKLKKLETGLREEAIEKIELFTSEENHKILKLHKLKGRFGGCYSFSVNYKTRIVFMYIAKSKKEAVLLAIGDHDIYK
mgnify:FL=1